MQISPLLGSVWLSSGWPCHLPAEVTKSSFKEPGRRQQAEADHPGKLPPHTPAPPLHPSAAALVTLCSLLFTHQPSLWTLSHCALPPCVPWDSPGFIYLHSLLNVCYWKATFFQEKLWAILLILKVVIGTHIPSFARRYSSRPTPGLTHMTLSLKCGESTQNQKDSNQKLSFSPCFPGPAPQPGLAWVSLSWPGPWQQVAPCELFLPAPLRVLTPVECSFIQQVSAAGHAGKENGQSPGLQGGYVSGTLQTDKLTNKIILNFAG